MKTYTLPEEVSVILRKSTIVGNSLKLPDGPRLDPKLYTKVNKAIEVAGGKWNKKAQVHFFEGNPREKLEPLMEIGFAKVPDTEKKTFQSFYTPPELAQITVGLARVSGCSVLEPSAGMGALVTECINQGAESIDCIELNPSCEVPLFNAGVSFHIGDFLSVKPTKAYDRIVMNPPFTRNQDITHVAHALKFLKKEGGILVSIMSGNTQRTQFNNMIDLLKWQIIPNEKGSFKSSGTNIETITLIIWT